VDAGELRQRRHVAVGVDLDRLEEARRGAAGPEAAEFLTQRLDCAVHPPFEIFQQGFFRHDLSPGRPLPCRYYVSSVMIVNRPFPRTTLANPPVSKIENTRIGMRFSRASEIADASITCRSRDSTSR